MPDCLLETALVYPDANLITSGLGAYSFYNRIDMNRIAVAAVMAVVLLGGCSDHTGNFVLQNPCGEVIVFEITYLDEGAVRGSPAETFPVEPNSEVSLTDIVPSHAVWTIAGLEFRREAELTRTADEIVIRPDSDLCP